MDQQGGPAGTLDERADRGTPGADDRFAFPVPWYRSVLGLGGPLAKHDVDDDTTVCTRSLWEGCITVTCESTGTIGLLPPGSAASHQLRRQLLRPEPAVPATTPATP